MGSITITLMIYSLSLSLKYLTSKLHSLCYSVKHLEEKKIFVSRILLKLHLKIQFKRGNEQILVTLFPRYKYQTRPKTQITLLSQLELSTIANCSVLDVNDKVITILSIQLFIFVFFYSWQHRSVTSFFKFSTNQSNLI